MNELIKATQYLIVFIALMVACLYLLSLSVKIRNFIYKQSYSIQEKIGMILLFGFFGVLASEYGLNLFGVVFNFRDCIAIFAGILGGPAVGIGAGLLSGSYRMTGVFWTGWTGTLGYWSAIGCGLATIGAGFAGAWLSKYKGMKIGELTNANIWKVAGITAIWEIIHLQVLVPLISPLYTDKTFWGIQKLFAANLLGPMIIANALGILLFLFITRDILGREGAELALAEIEKTEKEIEKLKKG